MSSSTEYLSSSEKLDSHSSSRHKRGSAGTSDKKSFKKIVSSLRLFYEYFRRLMF